MAVLRVLGEKVIVANTPAWTRKKHGLVIKEYNLPPALELGTPLGAQQMKLMNAAHSSRGVTGKMRYKGVSMPAIAVKIAGEIGGSVGGKTKAQRAQEAYDATSKRIANLQGRSSYVGNSYYGRQVP